MTLHADSHGDRQPWHAGLVTAHGRTGGQDLRLGGRHHRRRPRGSRFQPGRDQRLRYAGRRLRSLLRRRHSGNAHRAAGRRFGVRRLVGRLPGAGACQATVGAGTTPTARFEKAQPAGPGPSTDPGPSTHPQPSVRARLLVKQLRAKSVRTRCAGGSATVTRSHRRVCTKLAITVEGTIAKQARGTVSIKIGARVHGRLKTVTADPQRSLALADPAFRGRPQPQGNRLHQHPLHRERRRRERSGHACVRVR